MKILIEVNDETGEAIKALAKQEDRSVSAQTRVLVAYAVDQLAAESLAAKEEGES
jgi:hypothetical protein